MKKILTILLSLLMVMTMTSNNVFAEENVAKIGETEYATFEGALTAANATANATITLLKDCTYKTNGSGLWNITSSMTIDGEGHKLSGWGNRSDNNTTLAINNCGSTSANVTLKDLTIESTANPARPIETRGNIETLILDNVTLKAESDGNNQLLTVGGSQQSIANIKLNDTQLIGGKASYGVISFNPVTWTIEDSSISAWGCMYFKGKSGSYGSRNTIVKAKNSTFTSNNYTKNGGQNDFGTFDLEDDGITINLENCDLIATQSYDNNQYVFVTKSSAQRQTNTSTITITGDNTKVKEKIFEDYWPSGVAKLVVNGGIYHMDPTSYVADGYVVISNTDETTKTTYPYRVVKGVASITAGSGESATTTYYATIDDAYEAAKDGQSINIISEDVKKSVKENVSPEKPFVDSNTKENVVNDTTVPENSENGIATKVAEIVVDDIKDNSSMSNNNSSDIQTIVNGMDNINNKVADSAQLKITIESAVSTTTAKTVNEVSTTTITTTKAAYDVKPWVTIETTVGGVITTTTRIITNDELKAANATINFRLPVPSTMTGSIVKVSHYEDGFSTADWTRNYKVQTAANGNRYIELSASSFSVYELSQYTEESSGGTGSTGDSGTRYKVPNTGVLGVNTNNSISKAVGLLSLVTLAGYVVIKKKED